MSSVAALEDAATELFLEQGYQNISIDEIARRAGISRATFFNYCTTKSDVLWVDVDRALQSLDTLLGSAMPLRVSCWRLRNSRNPTARCRGLSRR